MSNTKLKPNNTNLIGEQQNGDLMQGGFQASVKKIKSNNVKAAQKRIISGAPNELDHFPYTVMSN
jgi:hypothetical protein